MCCYTFQDSGSIAFHLFTDAQNFYAMKHWFDRNSYLEAAVHVTNIEDHQLSKDGDSLDIQQLWTAEEFRVTIRNHSEPLQRQMKTEYISVFGHSHFLPDLLPSLNRVVVLDDDLIVQKDLSSLWNLNMGGKVIGAIQSCGVRLGQLRASTAEHNFFLGEYSKGGICCVRYINIQTKKMTTRTKQHSEQKGKRNPQYETNYLSIQLKQGQEGLLVR
jgi:lipopolysaccharide biosynthesis glycosyltransferase